MGEQTTYEYRCIAYRQGPHQDSPWILTFVAAAEELLLWAGIPRRSDDNMAGFQRGFDESRVERARAFFDMPENQSPTALVIGLHPADTNGAVRVTFDGGEERAAIRQCTLQVHHPSKIDLESAVPLIKAQIAKRLELSDQSGDELGDSDEPSQGEEEGDQDSPTEGELELGRSLLMRLAEQIDDEAWRENNRDALLDMAKPATVIDGQHRLKGAERCERNIPFTVCALLNCPWAEQVFQFTVVNYTQKGIEDQFITANAALSLTQYELGVLQDRLVQAGVKVVEYDLMKVVQFHDESPFRDLVNLTEKKDPSKIGYKTMVRLASAWYGAKHQVFRLLLPMLYPDLPGKGAHKTRVARWKEEDWGLFFLDFWKVVHDAYAQQPSHDAGHRLWDVGHSNLIVAIVLFEFQQAFLDSLNAQDEEFFEPREGAVEAIRTEMRQKLQRRARKFVEWFPAEFFATNWKQKSLSIGPGRKALQDTFTKMVTKKGVYQYGLSGLITGQTAG